MPGFGRAAYPVAVADDRVAQLALGIQLVEHAVGETRPRHEFALHLHLALGAEVLGQLDQRIRRVPGGPAQAGASVRISSASLLAQ